MQSLTDCALTRQKSVFVHLATFQAFNPYTLIPPIRTPLVKQIVVNNRFLLEKILTMVHFHLN
jgi:hypothetical protein